MNRLDHYVLEILNLKCGMSIYSYVYVYVYDTIAYALIINYTVCWGVYCKNTWIPDRRVCSLTLQDEHSYLRNILNTKGTLSNFHKNLYGERLAWGHVPIRRSWPGLGRDIWNAHLITCFFKLFLSFSGCYPKINTVFNILNSIRNHGQTIIHYQIQYISIATHMKQLTTQNKWPRWNLI